MGLEFVKSATAAKEMDVSIRTIQEWCKSKRYGLVAVKVGKDWRIERGVWETFKKRMFAGKLAS